MPGPPGGDDRHRRLPRQLPYALALLWALLALVVVALHHFRVGTTLLVLDMLAVGLARATLPPDRLGMLVVRRRTVDVVAYLGLAAALGVLAVVVPG